MLCFKMLKPFVLFMLTKNSVKLNFYTRRALSTATNIDKPVKWDLLCGICLERKPALTKELNEIERNFYNYLQQVEKDGSLKSDHEMRGEADQRRADSFKSGIVSAEDMDKSVGESANEFQDRCTTELQEFTPAPRITEADQKHDTKSTERSLDKHLLYIVSESLGNEKHWILPHGIRNDGESLRQAAERILTEKCGNNIKARFFGNAPCGVYKYKYPKEIRDKNNVIGAKIFYYYVQFLEGEIKSKTDFAWATRNEIAQQLHPIYYKNIKLFLIDDD